MTNRKKTSMILVVALLLGSLAAACDTTPPKPTVEEEMKRAEALKAAVVGHESWPQHTEFKGIKKSSDGTHGPFVQIWFNDKAAAVMGKFDGTYPEGSIFVKRGYDDEAGTKPKGFVTVMQKIKDYDAANGGWFTLRIWDNDTHPLSGWAPDSKVTDCVACHSSAKAEHDYIRFTMDFKFKF